MSATKTLKVYNFQYLQDDNVSTFDLLCSQHAITIIDFWTIRCTRCPAALTKLNDEAKRYNGLNCVSCCLGDHEIAKDMVDGTWENLIHLSVDAETKELLKTDFNFNQVPFSLVITQNLEVLYSGDPKNIDFSKYVEHSQNFMSAGLPKETNSTSASQVPVNMFNCDDF